jgi:hypothetical protein
LFGYVAGVDCFPLQGLGGGGQSGQSRARPFPHHHSQMHASHQCHVAAASPTVLSSLAPPPTPSSPLMHLIASHPDP